MNLSIFQFYYNIAFNQELIKINSEFLGNKELLDEGFIYYKDLGQYVNHIMEVEDPVDPVFSITKINRGDFILLKLEDNKKAVLSELRDYKTKKSDEDFKIYLKSIFDELDKYYIKINTSPDFIFKNIIKSHLDSLITDLKILFIDVSGHHKLFNHILTINYENTFFGCKDLKMSFFKELYTSTYELNLIDDSVIDEETFINVLTSPTPISDSPIVFLSPNAVVSYYLESIEVFFNNLNPNRIEQSGMFLNKQKTPITSTILYASKSRASEKAKSQYSNIDFHIDALKKQFLE